MDQALLLRIIELTKTHQLTYSETLESKCITKILDFIIDLTNYDLVDVVYCNRIGPIIISYQLITKVCKILRVNHLFDKFLIIYSNRLSSYLINLGCRHSELYKICDSCNYAVIVDTYRDIYQLTICNNNHKIISTDHMVDNRRFNDQKYHDSAFKCDSLASYMTLPINYKASFNSQGEILITNKQYQKYLTSCRRDKLYLMLTPEGQTVYTVDNNIKSMTSCIKKCSSHLNNKFVEKVYKKYQKAILTDSELKRIDIILNKI